VAPRGASNAGLSARRHGPSNRRPGLIVRAGARFRGLGRVGRFGVVGAVAVVVDIAVTNLLFFGLGWGPLAAKSVALLVATTLAFLGHRRWTFPRVGHNESVAGEYFRYWVVNLIGLGANLAVIRLGELVVQLDQVVAFNVVANGIGVLLAAALRYVLYLAWVFPGAGDDVARPAAE